MRHLRLTEYGTEPAVPLSAEERDTLRRVVTVEPTPGTESRYDLTPGSTIGALEVGDLAVNVSPKLPIDRVLFLISYALDPAAWWETGVDLEESDSLVEAIIPGFVRQVRRAFRRGVLQGYRSEEEALTTVRGRLLIEDQIRRRYGIAPPAEVRFDDFTEDIEVNRLIKAAIGRLAGMRIRSSRARAELRSFDGSLATVSAVDYDPHRLPEIAWTRLNAHYRPAVELATLIVRAASFELRRGDVRSTAFLVDMNRVFEDFVVTALRESLGVGPQTFIQGDGRLRLDRGGRVRLQPDVSWWDGRRCRFVGDVKYKRADGVGRHADLYQLLAYVVAADLPTGLLVYAAGEDEPATHQVVHLGRRLELTTLYLAGPPGEILRQIDQVGARISAMRRETSVPLAG